MNYYYLFIFTFKLINNLRSIYFQRGISTPSLAVVKVRLTCTYLHTSFIGILAHYWPIKGLLTLSILTFCQTFIFSSREIWTLISHLTYHYTPFKNFFFEFFHWDTYSRPSFSLLYCNKLFYFSMVLSLKTISIICFIIYRFFPIS